MSKENIRHEGVWRVKVVRHYEAIIDVDASSKFEAERYARSDENQHIANHDEDRMFHRFYEINQIYKFENKK